MKERSLLGARGEVVKQQKRAKPPEYLKIVILTVIE
jgi:hypothetical protein